MTKKRIVRLFSVLPVRSNGMPFIGEENEEK
jgi:hypothetical protein